MLHFPDSETGYYDPEERFYALDAEHEAVEEARYLEELEASHGDDFNREPIMPPDDIDPETGCTAAEMESTPSAPDITFPQEMSTGQMITARWGRGARRRRGIA